MAELDWQTSSNFTSAYATEVQQWWDAYGPSNWGAATEESSALVGIANVQDLISGGDAKRAILPGGLGCITHKLVEVLAPKYQERMLDNAAVVAVVQDKDAVRVTYVHREKLITVTARVVLMCTPKHITSRIVMGLPSEQKTAMRHYRYAPYPVVNVIFDRPVYNRGYDNWCPGSTFTDFIVADWTIRNDPGYRPKYNILSFYTPLLELQRFTLLDESDCKSLAARVLADFQNLMPEFNVDPVEVRIYRRGHPMFMAVPGHYTKTRLASSHPIDPIFFDSAHSDGPA